MRWIFYKPRTIDSIWESSSEMDCVIWIQNGFLCFIEKHSEIFNYLISFTHLRCFVDNFCYLTSNEWENPNKPKKKNNLIHDLRNFGKRTIVMLTEYGIRLDSKSHLRNLTASRTNPLQLPIFFKWQMMLTIIDLLSVHWFFGSALG